MQESDESAVSSYHPTPTVLPPQEAEVRPASSVGDRLKKIGWTVAGIALFVLVLVVPVLLLQGAVWASENLLPLLMFVAVFVFAVDVAVLLPLSAVRGLRTFTGAGLQWSSILFGITTWLSGFIVTLDLWGWFAVVLGLFMFGVGVVPMGMVASVFNGAWPNFFWLGVMISVTFGTRLVGMAISESGAR